MRTALATVAFAAIVSAAGCSSSPNSNENASSAPATDTPAPAASASYHRRHHRRHRREGGQDQDAQASGGAVAGAVAGTATTSGTGTAPTGGAWPCNNQQFLTDQQQFATGALQGYQEVDVCGTVTNVLASKTTRSGLHGYYDLQVAPGTTIEIVSDLGEMDAPAWPWVKTGDYSYVQGRYYYDSASTQGIDWTHHGTSRSWSSAGYVVVGGTQYQ